MNDLARTVLVAAVFCFLCLPAQADDTTPSQVIQASLNTVDVPQSPVDAELAGKHADFAAFAKGKVRQLNSNHRLSRSRMEVLKQKDGSYRARYHEIDDSTLSVQVRRSQSRSIPFVGVLAYREQVFECSASTVEQLGQGLFKVVEVIPNRHIFSYQKGNWN